jgi:leucyl aminopeptidase
MIKTHIKNTPALTHSTPCLILFCLEGEKDALLKQTDTALKGAITRAAKDKRFEAKLNQTLLIPTLGALKAEHVLLVGVGKADDLTADRLRQAGGTAGKLAEKSRLEKIACALPGKKFHSPFAVGKKHSAPSALARAVAEGLLLALYHFDVYKTVDAKNGKPARVKEIIFLQTESGAANLKHARQGIERAAKTATAVWMARDLQSHPSNKATPTYLADTARAIARAHRLRSRILNLADMRQLGMGALLGVARGSHEPAAFIVLEYSGGKKSHAPVVLVGKGVTFDTGGISLKPASGMDEMKMDMSGASAVLGALQAVADLRLPVNVVGLVPATENMPGGSAIKPGDILKSLSGKTIEVLNTDAEGRLILCDALTYAQRYKPRAIIDLATLTGAVITALGHHAGAILGNNADLTRDLIAGGAATGERLWELPLWEEYQKAVKSDIADLKNIAGPNVGAGTIVGAAFLKEFIDEKTPWAHIDIAGTAWGEETPYNPKGPSGYGIRLLIHYLENLDRPPEGGR